MRWFRSGMVVVALLLGPRPLHAQIVISQIYGGGGNSGATFKNDFVELFNSGASDVNLLGWSVQYAASTGSSWQGTSLIGTLQPGQYFLVQEAQGIGGTTNLPTPDATGTIPMSATAGKIAVRASTTVITVGCPVSGQGVVDFVGYGTGTDCFEGTGPTATLSNTTAALRAGMGCTDSDDNANDFSTGAPNPRNTSSTLNPCVATATPTDTPSQTPTITPTATPTNMLIPVGGACSTGSECVTTVCVDGVCVTAPAAAPALTPWGLLVVMILLAALGASSLRQHMRSR